MKQFKISQSITDRSDDSLIKYFKEVSKIPMINKNEETDLAIKAKDGDKNAMDKLIVSHLRFVISVAKQYQHKGVPLIDLIQTGNIGLIEGIRHYDVSKGTRLLTFAVWYIRQAIMKELLDKKHVVHIPLNQLSYTYKINKMIENFEKNHGVSPDIHEIEEQTSLSSEQINMSVGDAGKAVSLSAPFKNEDVNCMLDVIPDNNITPTDMEVEQHDVQQKIEKIIDKLHPRNGDVIRMAFGIGMPALPNDEIARRFGVGAERIRQLIKNTVIYLRKHHLTEFKELL